MASNNMGEKSTTDRSVREYYAGKSIFITGGTGFLGKVFIEKMLYSCERINKIYLLVRPKKNLNAEDRVNAIISSPVFERIKNTRPLDLQKIIPIVGDLTIPNMGIVPEDEKRLLKDVSVVFHSGATVKFNEPLSVAMKINLEGTREVLKLSRRMKQLKVFVHISTTYTNSNIMEIDEKLYPPPKTAPEVYDFLKRYGDDEAMTEKCIEGRPNTYTFTKAIAENLVKEERGHLPVIIIRPSVVIPSVKEPSAGWIDNWYGVTGIVVPVGKGFSRIIFGDKNNVIDVIPVDYTCNVAIIAPTRCDSFNPVTVYNSCSSSVNPLPMCKIIHHFCIESKRQNLNELPCPGAIFIESPWVMAILSFFWLTIPAYLADFWLTLNGKSKKFVKLAEKIVAVRTALTYFTGRNWVIHTRNVQALEASLSPEERAIFPCDPSGIDWADYMSKYVAGIKKFLLNGKKI